MTTYTLPLSSNTIDLLANSAGYNVTSNGVNFSGGITLTTNLSDPLPFDYYDLLAENAYNLAQSAYNYANTLTGSSSTDNVARQIALSAQANTVIIQGVNVTQNTNITTLQGVNATQNTWISSNNTLQTGINVTQNTRIDSIETVNSNQNTTINIIQGVNDFQNTRLNSIETINLNQNTSISIIQGVDNTQNTNITAVNQFAQAAYNQANTANSSASTSIDSFARTTANGANGLAQGAYNKANTALANTTGTLSGSLYITGALGVGTAASGTTGEIRATDEITAYYSSDERLKENIQKIDNALYKLRKVRGVMFDWRDEVIEKRGGEDNYFVRKHDTGVIAQEVEQVLPEVVAIREDGYKAVRYEKLAGIIIQAINELADEVEEIKKRLK